MKTSTTHPADCGATFEHDKHFYLYDEKKNKIKVCDGDIKKRTS